LAVTPNDVLFPQQWWMQKVSAPQAWDITTGSSAVVVNINDSGIDYTHPDLYRNVWLNQKEIPFAIGGNALRDTDSDGLITFWDLNARTGNGQLVNGSFATDLNTNGYIDGGDLLNDPRWENGVDNGGNGFTDDLVGWDFVNQDNDPMDDYFHGTFMAGIVGSVGNNIEGGTGVAWRVQLMATKGLGRRGSGDVSDLMAGTRYSADNGARISNNSFGSTRPNKHQLALFSDNISYAATKGVLFVVGAGNEGWNNDIKGRGQIFPASIRLPNMISVAASTINDELDPISNYGLTTVDLAAPGDSIGSTMPLFLDPTAPYALAGPGTSLAAPFVAGAAALLLSVNPNLSYAQLKDRILTSVDPVPALLGKTVTGGRLNLYAALSVSGATSGAAATHAPSRLFAGAISAGRDWLATPDELLA
jgi:subtilisin family serine protease